MIDWLIDSSGWRGVTVGSIFLKRSTAAFPYIFGWSFFSGFDGWRSNIPNDGHFGHYSSRKWGGIEGIRRGFGRGAVWRDRRRRLERRASQVCLAPLGARFGLTLFFNGVSFFQINSFFRFWVTSVCHGLVNAWLNWNYLSNFLLVLKASVLIFLHSLKKCSLKKCRNTSHVSVMDAFIALWIMRRFIDSVTID